MCETTGCPKADSNLSAKAMGEEKPEEELMGKRKSSPRLSAACHAAILIMVE
ncbi:hypothetical protein [Salipaludibacillus aurantiacus]|uniref:hypothetical protein n=1 Tax=Salipaludibacillus aurantiacus TaxID=1601833 RepID=UPI0015A51E7C|nr:hypothetical protein [Salipaludibacillus aurantiacus]